MDSLRGYNVGMTTITTKLVRDGNSVAVRLPKTVLAMSGLHDDIQMQVTHGQIILRSASVARAGWKENINHIMTSNPAALLPDGELTDWDVTGSDGID